MVHWTVKRVVLVWVTLFWSNEKISKWAASEFAAGYVRKNLNPEEIHRFVEDFVNEMLPIERLLQITEDRVGQGFLSETEKVVVKSYGARTLADDKRTHELFQVLATMKASCDGEDLMNGLIASTMLSIIYTFHAKGAILYQELQVLDEAKETEAKKGPDSI